ncbi:MAG: glycosyltransferase, partial [Bifidobacteriaceae bacterium]|nr:glycosyltransferase [Bifidobacteriaceae bacterium]
MSGGPGLFGRLPRSQRRAAARAAASAQAQARALAASPLFDQGFYEELRGRQFPDAPAAAEDFCRARLYRAYFPHPLVNAIWLPMRQRVAWSAGAIDTVLTFLTSAEGLSAPWSILFDPRALTPTGQWPVVARYLDTLTAERPLPGWTPLDGGPATWGRAGPAMAAFARHLGRQRRDMAATTSRDDVAAGEAPIDSAPLLDGSAATVDGILVEGQVSAIVHAGSDARAALKTVTRLIRGAGEADLEVVVVAGGSPASASLAIAAGLIGTPATRLIREPQPIALGEAADAGAAHATGEFLVVTQAGVTPRPGWLMPLVTALGEPGVIGVQPVLLRPDGTIHSAGAVFFGPDRRLPTPVFTGHPPQDAAHLAGIAPDVLPREFFAMRTADFAVVGGFDRAMAGVETIDFSLRARAALRGRFALATASLAAIPVKSSVPVHVGPPSSADDAPAARLMARWGEHLPAPRPQVWQRGGFRVAAVATDGNTVPVPRPLLVREAAAPQRWGIVNPASATEVGDRWGDTAFAEALMRGLQTAGQDAVSYRRPARGALVRYLDDVSLTIRGLMPGSPLPGAINVLWVISRPDEIGVEEVRSFDLVYAASPVWARTMTRRAGIPVRVLLQATDPDVFSRRQTHAGRGARDGEVVFVGQARADGPRTIVMDAIAAGLEPRVWGPRWEGWIPDRLRGGDY